MHQKTAMPTAKQYTILLIDDSAEDRAAYCRYLERSSAHKYQVLEASSAAMGLDLYQRLLPDAILLDYSLPDMDGLEFLAVMQQTGKRVPVLMLIGQGDETIAAQAIKSGAQDYLIKGNLTANGLCKALDHAIEQAQLQQRLAQQEEQQQMLSAIALRIRQALTLQTILDTSVAEVRQYLNADRVVIYQFAPDISGQIVAEAVLPEWLVSLHIQVEDTCFRQNLGGDYRLGRTRAIDNIYEAGLTNCHIKLLERFQVKANLVVPLLITDQNSDSAEPHHDAALPQLWGLLVAHQCAATRQWQAFEIELLNQVAVQMAIAIQQATAYQRVQAELAKRQRIEAILLKSEQRYATLTEISPVGIFQTDVAGSCLYVNERWCQIAGLTPTEAAGLGWINGIYPDDRDVVFTEWCAAVQANRSFCLEYRFQNAAGQIIWVYGQAVGERDASGELVAYVGTITDINDRKQAELRLQAANRQITTIWTSMTDAYATLDHEWRIIYANPAAMQAICQLTNLKPEELLGKSHWEVFPSLVGQPIEQEYQRAVTEQVAVHLEVFYEPTENWFEAHAYPSAVGLGIYFRDISDRKQAETERQKAQQALQASTVALAQSEQRYRSLVMATTQAVWTADSEGKTTDDIPGWRTLTGQTEVEVQGWRWMDAIHPDDRAKTAEAWRIATTTKQLYEVEHRVRMADGNYKFFIGRAAPVLDETGNLREWIGAHTDISDRKHTEITMQQLNQVLETRVQERTAKLRASEARLREAQRIAHVGDWEFDLTTQKITWSEELFRLFGLDTSQGEPEYAVHIQSYVPDSRLQLEHAVQQAATLGTPYELELQLSRADGAVRWLLARGEAVRNVNGAIVKLLGTALDITDRKEAEQAIAKYTREVEDLYNNAPCGYHSLDGDGRFLTVNDTELHWLGYTRAEILGKSFADISTEASWRLFQTNYPVFKQRGLVQDVELDLVCKDGTLFPIFLSATAVKDAEGNYLHSRSTLYDARDRKQFEASLMQYERIISSTRDGVALLDRHYIYQVANQAYLTWCNKTHDDVIGHSVRDVLGSELFDNFVQPRLDQCLSGQMVQYEKWFDYPNIVPQFLSVTYTPYLDANQTIAGMIVSLRDITDRKQAEERLRKSDAHLKTAQRIATLGSWEFDLRTEQITWSEEVFRIFGRDPEAEPPTFEALQQLIHPDDRDRHQQAVQTAVATIQPYELEFRFYDSDGSLRYVYARGEPIVDTTGQIIQLVGTVLDITDRKEAEAALRESEHRYATLAAAAPVSIFRFDAAVNCVYVNDRWSEMTGRPAADGLGSKWVEAIHPQDREWISMEVAQWLQTCKAGDLYRNEARILRSDGSIVWFFCQMLPETDASGTITGYIGTLTDITDRKDAEEELRNLSDRLTLAVKSGAIAIWDWNVAENILTWDDRMYELYGITPDRFTSVYDAWASSLHPDDRPLAEAAIQQALAGEKDYDPEFRVLHPDSTIRFIKAYALVQRNEQGEAQQMIGINYDITDRKQAEQALQQLTIELQRSNQELEQFAYVASHDLQEPLRAITSYTQLLAKRYQGQLDAKADKYIYYVVDGAARMQMLIQDLLAYSRVGRYELKLQPTDCNAILEQVRNDLQVAIAESNAVITVDALPTIPADIAQVTQLFQNLMGNALKYRGQAASLINVTAKQQGKEWIFSIQDNGIGIEPQYAERIFEIFQRLHTRREYDGTGLGLAICKKIVERHHGRIWVESTLGQGATFCFTLPASLNDEYSLIKKE